MTRQFRFNELTVKQVVKWARDFGGNGNKRRVGMAYNYEIPNRLADKNSTPNLHAVGFEWEDQIVLESSNINRKEFEQKDKRNYIIIDRTDAPLVGRVLAKGLLWLNEDVGAFSKTADGHLIATGSFKEDAILRNSSVFNIKPSVLADAGSENELEYEAIEISNESMVLATFTAHEYLGFAATLSSLIDNMALTGMELTNLGINYINNVMLTRIMGMLLDQRRG
jgi:hypothetical protein